MKQASKDRRKELVLKSRKESLADKINGLVESIVNDNESNGIGKLSDDDFFEIVKVEFAQTLVQDIEMLESELKALKSEIISTVTRRMKSDEACGHPFDEDLSALLKLAESLEEL